MADNAIANPGAGGLTFATDDIAGVHWPFSKQAFGPRDTANEVEDVASKRLPVKVGDLLASATIVAGQVSLTGVEVALTTVAARRFRIKAQTNNTDTIYMGPAGVTTANGYPLWPGDFLEMQVSNLNVIHAIVGSGTQVLAYVGEV